LFPSPVGCVCPGGCIAAHSVGPHRQTAGRPVERLTTCHPFKRRRSECTRMQPFYLTLHSAPFVSRRTRRLCHCNAQLRPDGTSCSPLWEGKSTYAIAYNNQRSGLKQMNERIKYSCLSLKWLSPYRLASNILIAVHLEWPISTRNFLSSDFDNDKFVIELVTSSFT
jgi:hypothetical protein